MMLMLMKHLMIWLNEEKENERTRYVLERFSKFTGKLLCRIFFLNEITDEDGKFIKKRLRHRCFPMNLVKY